LAGDFWFFRLSGIDRLGARFIRVTGTNLENIARGRYNKDAGTMVVEKRPNFRGAA
jgi:hypothetical protein